MAAKVSFRRVQFVSPTIQFTLQNVFFLHFVFAQFLLQSSSLAWIFFPWHSSHHFSNGPSLATKIIVKDCLVNLNWLQACEQLGYDAIPCKVWYGFAIFSCRWTACNHVIYLSLSGFHTSGNLLSCGFHFFFPLPSPNEKHEARTRYIIRGEVK